MRHIVTANARAPACLRRDHHNYMDPSALHNIEYKQERAAQRRPGPHSAHNLDNKQTTAAVPKATMGNPSTTGKAVSVSHTQETPCVVGSH